VSYFINRREYGSKVLNIKPLLKKLQSILEDRDKSVRDEAKLLAIEIYSWIGPTPVKANLANLKPLQVNYLGCMLYNFIKLNI
jgi:cytoskeleton-associated protein 5